MPEVPGVIEHPPKLWKPKPLPPVTESLYRSDIFYYNQVQAVKQNQEELKLAILQYEASQRNQNEIASAELQKKLLVLKKTCDSQVMLLKIASKVHSEIIYARKCLSVAIKNGDHTEKIHQRMNWLDGRLMKILTTKVDIDESMTTEPEIVGELDVDNTKEKTTSNVHAQLAEGNEQGIFVTEVPVTDINDQALDTHSEEKEPDKDLFVTVRNKKLQRQQSVDSQMSKTLTSQSSKDSVTHSASVSQTPTSRSLSVVSDKSQKEEPSVQPASIVVPESQPLTAEQPEESGPVTLEADVYWESEHHRMKYADNVPVLLSLDNSSYHGLPIAVPGTYTAPLDGDNKPKLPWRPRRRDSEFEEVHKDALDKLLVRVHEMHSDMHDSAMLSVDPTYKLPAARPNIRQLHGMHSDGLDGSRPVTTADSVMRPETSNMPRLAGKLKVFVPMPLLQPPKLPTAKIDRTQLYPPAGKLYSDSVPGLNEPAVRIVNQGNLYEQTKFSGQLYSQKSRKTSRHYANTTTSSLDERRLKSWVNEEIPQVSAPVSSQASRSTRSRRTSRVSRKSKNLSLGGKQEVLASWKDVKPRSGALLHSGLKWERVKEIVHNNLTADRPAERQDAARTLGQLRCADTMVLYALRTAMSKDEDLQVQYEATKALLLLGSWESDVVQSADKFLTITTDNVKLDLLESIVGAKNVNFVNQETDGFIEFVMTLETLTYSECEEVSYTAAVALAQLGVESSEPARQRLMNYIFMEEGRRMVGSCGEDHGRMLTACECLVRQLRCRDWGVVRRLLREMRWAPNWRHRCAAARLLVALGPRHVCLGDDEEHTRRLFHQLEERLWEEAVLEVRLDVAKVIIALDMFPWACERAEKKLQNSDEEIRAEGVLAIGTLGVRNERIVRALLDMLELDGSGYVRILIIRTFASIGLPDKRILRSLREKERHDNLLSTEATKALQALAKSLPTKSNYF